MSSEKNLFQILSEREDDRSKYYSGYITQTKSNISQVLEYIRALFPNYPDHGINHSLRIIDYVSSILSDDFKDRLSSLEIAIFIFACLFHDTGMCLFNSSESEQDTIRQKHNLAAKEVIEKYFSIILVGMREQRRIKEAVIFVCEAHGFSLDELIKDKRFSKKDRIDSFEVHYDILAFMLRIGDLMDIEGDRANIFRMMLFSESFSEYSFNHNARHEKIESYYYNPDELTIRVYADNVSQYKIWDDWFSYLSADIEKSNALFSRRGFVFPIPHTEILKPDGAKYDVQELRFEIDDNGGMWEVISNSVYTNDLDFLRELLQNSIDASLKQIYLNNNYLLCEESPRSWNNYSKPIAVTFSEQEKKLTVTDYGVGMSPDDLHNYLFKVSGSGKANNDKRSFCFPGIAQYGIGFISCLVIANEIEIYTSKDGKSLYRVTIQSNRNCAFIETQDNEFDYIGTTVVLKIKKEYKDSDIRNYLFSTFRYPSVKIVYYNYDSCVGKLKNNTEELLIERITQNPYLFQKTIQDWQSSVQNTWQALLDYYQKIKRIKSDYYSLSKYFSDNARLITENQDEALKYNSHVDEFFTSADSLDVDSFCPEIYIQEKITWRTKCDELTSTIMGEYTKGEHQLWDIEGDVQTKMDNLHITTYHYGQDQVAQFGQWKYIFATLNENLEVIKVKESSSPISINDNQGILLINHNIIDYSAGIECNAISGFLCAKGKVCNRIVRLNNYTGDNYIRRTSEPDCLTIPLSGTREDISEDIKEFFDENEDILADTDFEYDYSLRSFDKYYDEIAIRDNTLASVQDCNMYDTDSSKAIDYRDLWKNLRISSSVPSSLSTVLNRILAPNQALFCQDGIAIPSDLQSLFPMGLFRITCNLTASSRMKLNITRHNTSELRQDTDEWLKTIGNKIQQSIFDNVIYSLEASSIYVDDYEELLWAHDCCKTYFQNEAYSNLKRILKRKR